MKVLLDAHLPHHVIGLLTDRGRDAASVSARDDLQDNAPDAEIKDTAHAEGRAVVTANVKDFRPIAAARLAAGQGHAGLILVSPNRRRNKAASKDLADAIEAVMTANPDGLADSERWI